MRIGVQARSRKSALVGVLALGVAFLDACTPRPPAASPTAASSADPTSAPALANAKSPGPLPPLASQDPYVRLAVADHGDAVVSLPLGATSRRPILVAAGGAGDTPEWQCQVWRDMIQNAGFVLCPRGLPLNPGASGKDLRYYYRNHYALEREVAVGLDALRAKFPDYVDDGPVLYVGFSQGATMGMHLLLQNPKRFPRAVLIEGGMREWLPAATRRYRKGGERVLLVCGQPRCVTASRLSADLLERAGVKARAAYGEGEGHGYAGVVAREVRRNFAWLVEGDARWASVTVGDRDR
jgi:pimeloyl-ACP methyl ester carboxylesterase